MDKSDRSSDDNADKGRQSAPLVKLETLDSNSDVSANTSDVDDDVQYDELTDVSARSDDNILLTAKSTPVRHYQKNQAKSSKQLNGNGTRRQAAAGSTVSTDEDKYARDKLDYVNSLTLNTMEIFDPNKAVCADCRRLDYLSTCQVHCDLDVCDVCVQKHLQIELNEFIRIKSFLENSANEIRRTLSAKRSLCNENIKSSIQMKKFINLTLQQIKRKIELELESKRDELLSAVDTFIDNQKRINLSINDKTFQTTERICTEIDNLILMPDDEINPVKLKSLKAFSRSYALKLKKQKAAKIPFYSIFFVPDSNIKIESPFGKIVLKSHDHNSGQTHVYDKLPGSDELDLGDVADATDTDNISLLDEQVALNHTFQTEVAFLSDQKHFDTSELFSDKELAQLKANASKTPVQPSALYNRSASLSTSYLNSTAGSGSMMNLATPSFQSHLNNQSSTAYSVDHYATSRRPLHYLGSKGAAASTSELANTGLYATLKTKVNGQDTGEQRILLSKPIEFPCDNRVQVLPYTKPIEPMQISLLRQPAAEKPAPPPKPHSSLRREASLESRNRELRRDSKPDEPRPPSRNGQREESRPSAKSQESKESTDSEDLKDNSSSESVRSDKASSPTSEVPNEPANSSFVPSHILLAQIGQTPTKRPSSVKVINRPGSYQGMKPQAPTPSSLRPASSMNVTNTPSLNSSETVQQNNEDEDENLPGLPPRSPQARHEHELSSEAQSAIKTVKPVKTGLRQRLMKLGPRLVNF